MATTSQYNLKSPAVKRIMKEASELREATEDYYAQPLEENIFEWHFTIRGSRDTSFSEGYYHGRIILPTEYPMRPPSIMMLTPNGRFVTDKKICLTISGHHPETWMPSWSIRTVLLALIGFMPSESLGTVGSLNFTDDMKKKLAKESISWSCTKCGQIKDLVKERELNCNAEKDNKNNLDEKDREFAKLITFKSDNEGFNSENQEEKKFTKIEGNTQQTVRHRNLTETPVDRNRSSTTSNTNQNVNNTDDRPNFNLKIIIVFSLILLILIRRIFLLFF